MAMRAVKGEDGLPGTLFGQPWLFFIFLFEKQYSFEIFLFIFYSSFQSLISCFCVCQLRDSKQCVYGKLPAKSASNWISLPFGRSSWAAVSLPFVNAEASSTSIV